jgi:hypothetical protein
MTTVKIRTYLNIRLFWNEVLLGPVTKDLAEGMLCHGNYFSEYRLLGCGAMQSGITSGLPKFQRNFLAPPSARKGKTLFD